MDSSTVCTGTALNTNIDQLRVRSLLKLAKMVKLLIKGNIIEPKSDEWKERLPETDTGGL